LIYCITDSGKSNLPAAASECDHVGMAKDGKDGKPGKDGKEGRPGKDGSGGGGGRGR